MVIMQNQNTEKKKKIHGTSVREMQLQHSHNTVFQIIDSWTSCLSIYQASQN
jgi:hypothetical protein